MPQGSAPPNDFVPAAGHAGLTRAYDAVVALTMREGLVRGRLVADVAAQSPETVLEIGAGTGTVALRLAEALPHARVVGLDPDDEALAIARAKPGAAGVDWQRGSATRLDLPDASVDAVVASLVLHHLRRDDKDAALREARRVLRRGGTLHVADWGRPQDLLAGVGFLALRSLDGFAVTADHARGALPRLIADAGFAGVTRLDRLRTVWGTLELLRAQAPAPRYGRPMPDDPRPDELRDRQAAREDEERRQLAHAETGEEAQAAARRADKAAYLAEKAAEQVAADEADASGPPERRQP